MLQKFPMYAYIPVANIARARQFYEQKLGFKPGHEVGGGVSYEFADGTACFMYPTPNAGTSKASQAFWRVDDIEREVAELRERGVTFEEYDMPGLKTRDGIATGGGAKSAWFKDTEGNILALIQEEPAKSTATPTADEGGWIAARVAAGYRTDIGVREHHFIADEPTSVGGTDTGPTPYDLLLGALGACTAMTLRMYANRKGWPLEEAVVRLREARSYAADCENCEKQVVGIRRIEREIDLKGALTAEQRERLLAIADRCPIKQTLERGLAIVGADGSVARS